MLSGFDMETRALAPETFLIAVRGEVDLHTSPAMKKRMQQALAEGYRNLVVDLNQVQFIESTGLAAVLHTFHKVQDEGGRFAVLCSNERLQRLLSMSGLADAFLIRPTLESLSATAPWSVLLARPADPEVP